MRSLLDRFEAKYIPEPNSGCWLWIGACHPSGYGNIGYMGRVEYAHRISWLLQYGELPSLDVCHTCDVRQCVNPDHLWLGTHEENIADAVAKGRQTGPIGSKSSFAKLNETQVLLILEDKRDHQSIAADYGCTPENIGHIKNGRTWIKVREAWLRA